ncbi:hypothetical protein Taro_033006, partial [Colocasia esculenta]|nr:hypothetical protein [Colocasia esculenta]
MLSLSKAHTFPLNLSLAMEGTEGKPWTGLCTIVAVDSGTTSYLACSICERTLPEGVAGGHCRYCNHNAFNPGSFGSKRLYRLHLSVATADKVVTVMCFDRMAQLLFGCSADVFFDFCKLNPKAVDTACKILEGGMFKMTLSRPKNGNAQHLRVTSLVPLSSQFQPVIEILKKH